METTVKPDVIGNIAEYMSSHNPVRTYTRYEASIICSSICDEFNHRRKMNIKKTFRTREAKYELNAAIAKMANERIGRQAFTAEDIHLYKKCRAAEWENRTGRCAFGFKDVRARLGYDPETGREIV